MHYRNYLFIMVSLLAMTLLAACNQLPIIDGNGDIVEVTPDIEPFEALDLRGGGRIEVTIGDEQSLTIETDSNIQEYITVSNEDDTLVIAQDPNVTLNANRVYRLTTPDLNRLTITGGAVVILPEIDQDSLFVDISGAATINAERLTLDTLTVEFSGAGNFVVDRGTVTEQDVNISGAGSYDMSRVDSETISIRLSGAGTARLNASERISGTLSGLGEIVHSGDADVDINVSGLGNVRPANN